MGTFDVSADIALVQGDYQIVRAGADGGEVRSDWVHLTVPVLEARSRRIRTRLFRPAGQAE